MAHHRYQNDVDVNIDDDDNFLSSDEIILGEEDIIYKTDGIIIDTENMAMIEEDINDLLPSSSFETRPPRRRRHYTDDAERYQVAKQRRKGQQQHAKDSIFCDEEEEEDVESGPAAAILSFFSNNGRRANNTPIIPDNDGENNNDNNNSASTSSDEEEDEVLNHNYWLSYSDAKEKLVDGSKETTTKTTTKRRQRTISTPSFPLQQTSIVEDGIWNTTSSTDDASRIVSNKTKFNTMVDPDDDSFNDDSTDEEGRFNPEWLSMVDVGGEEEKVDDDEHDNDNVEHEVVVYDDLDETKTQRRQRTWSTSSTTIATTPKRCLIKVFYFELKQLIGYIIQHNRTKSNKKRIFSIMMLIITILVFIDLIFGTYIDTTLSKFIMWMADNGLQATFTFVVTFTFATLICVPPTILIFGAGYAFGQSHESRTIGVLVAIFACFLGSFIGSVLAFVRARYLMRDMVQMFARRYPLVKAADQALKQNGFRIMILLRLCPLIPFNGLNYCCGITGVSTIAFVNSLVGILPFQIYTVVIGAMAATLVSKHSGLMAWTLLACTGLLFGLVALVFLWRIVKKELQKELHLTSAELEVFFVSDHSSSAVDVDDDHSTINQSNSQQMRDDIETGMSNDLVELSSSSKSSSSSLSVGQLQHQDAAAEEWFWVWA